MAPRAGCRFDVLTIFVLLSLLVSLIYNCDAETIRNAKRNVSGRQNQLRCLGISDKEGFYFDSTLGLTYRRFDRLNLGRPDLYFAKKSCCWFGVSRRKYLVKPVLYYDGSTATFQLYEICISGDVKLNPGPITEPTERDRDVQCRTDHIDLAVTVRDHCKSALKIVYTRQYILDLRFSEVVRLSQALAGTGYTHMATILHIRRCSRPRGCRGGRRKQQALMRRLNFEPALIDANALENGQPTPIPVIITTRRSPPNQLSNQRCLSRQRHNRCSIRCKPQVSMVSGNNHGLLPTFYLINPTSIAKPDAFEHFKTDVINFNVDIAIICETWLKAKHDSRLFAISGYALHRQDRIGRIGGGLCVYVCNQFTSLPYCFARQRISVAYTELLWIQVLNSNDLNIVLGVCYHPPKPKYATAELIDLIVADVEDISTHSPHSTIIFAGDLNGLDCSELEQQCGLKLVNQAVTHGRNLLDKFYTSRPDRCITYTVSSCIKTKHKAIILKDVLAEKPANSGNANLKTNIFRRCFDVRAPNLIELQTSLARYNWNILMCDTNVDSVYSDFVKIVNFYISQHIPSRRVNLGKNAPKYITPLVKTLLRRRNRLLRAGKCEIAGELSGKIGKLISDNRANSLAGLTCRDTKSLWKTVGDAQNNRDDHSLADLGHPFDNPDAINEYFVKVSTDPTYDRQKIIDLIESLEDDPNLNTSSEFRFRFHEYQVYRALTALKRTSQGCDPLPHWVLKKCAYQLAPVITHLFNIILQTSTCPQSWKHSLVTPIPKTNPPHDLSDLRPISVTPILSRIYEKLFTRNFLFHSFPKELLIDQFGFKPTGSTTAALSYIFQNVAEALEHSDHVRCFMIDFSKAFDTIPHYELLLELKNVGCHRVLIKWIANFLIDRTQSVACASGFTTPLKITRGSVQGSGTGPFNFAAYFSSLRPRYDSSTYGKYADDLTALIRNDALAAFELEHIQRWAIDHKMSLNMSKTKEIVFRRPRIARFVIPDALPSIEQVDDIKLLGIHFNSKLNFASHIVHVASAVSQRFYLLGQLKLQGLNKKCLEVVFNAIVLGKMTYASQSFYGFLNENELNKLQKLLRKAHRLGFITNELNIREIYEDANFKLFRQITKNPDHALFPFIPGKARSNSDLRPRGHTYELPVTKTDRYKSTFLVRSLYQYV